jgi:hypothetical protein
MVRLSSPDKLEAKPDAPSLKRFILLLGGRDCLFWDEDHLHEVIEVRETKPDFFVQTAEKDEFLVEVKSFDGESRSLAAFRNGNRVMSGLSSIDYKQIRSRLDKAAGQLKPYERREIPLLIVLDDFRGTGVPCNPDILLAALYGLDGGFAFFRERDKRYISAVGWLLGNDSSLFLRIVHNRWAQVPLPKRVFQRTQDEHCGIDEHGHIFGLL